MRGVFKSRVQLVVFASCSLVMSSVIAVRFLLWGIAEGTSGNPAASAFSLAFAVFGLLWGILSILLLRYNHHASLIVDSESLRVKCGWREECVLPLAKITDATLNGQTLLLSLGADGMTVHGLTNAKEICQYLRRVIARSPERMNVQKEKNLCLLYRKKQRLYLFPTIACCLLLFVHIAWFVALTEGRELSAFSAGDNQIFLAFTVAELLTVVLAFLFAQACGKARIAYEQSKKRCSRAVAWAHRQADLSEYGGVLRVRYVDGEPLRVVVFALHKELYAYVLEKFDLTTMQWRSCYSGPRTVGSLSEMAEELDDVFGDLIFEDEETATWL
ncbi:MAG: hypothetical protein IJY20_03920 [Clostridia bacterium]|nr:hypothetical protein [Clostridia bacterium]